MKRTLLAGLIIASGCAAGLPMAGCSTAPKTESKRAELAESVEGTISEFKRRDPSMAKLFDESYAYAVFPSVGKGGVGVGGAYGRGEVFQGGRKVGYTDLSQGTIGLQLGGQVYSEVIFFENKASYDRFKTGEFAFSAQATAVAANAGASADADYRDGVLVFTMSQGGLMYEASIGGQKFGFEPLN
jgi:lipid-binding SYLF domain-containing protein